ncbi:MAG: S1 RNA-binding domain-containing protein, partial [Planctomycetia bacterium]
MSSPSDDAATGPDTTADAATPRRIPIGTQRPGVKPPSLAPKYQYAAPAADAAPAAAPVPAAEATVASSNPPVPAAPAAIPPAGDRPAGRGGRRDKRRDAAPKSAFSDVLPPAKRVAVPNLRSALDDELEADYEAALAGLAVDDVLAAEAAAKADAPLDPGTRLVGTVLAIGPDTAFIDLGARRQGAMRLAGLLEDGVDLPAVGATVQVTVGSRNEEDGLYDVAPANRAVAVEDWSQLQAGMIVAAQVKAANKGGLECEVGGLRGFMPASLVSTWRVENLEEMVGQSLECLVTELVPEARRLVLSRRAVIEKRAADAKAEMLETLEPGTELDGIVRNVRDFGAFVDIGNGVEGLVHVSELSWE